MVQRVEWFGPYNTKVLAKEAAFQFANNQKGEVIHPNVYVNSNAYYFSAVRKKNLYDFNYILECACNDAINYTSMSTTLSPVLQEQKLYMNAYAKFEQVVTDITIDLNESSV